MDHLNFIMRLEGEDHTLTSENIIDGVAAMIKDGTIWQLQGSYGRMGVAMIEQGYVDQEGNVLGYPEEVA